jgi:hypothetical protein
MPKKKSSTSAKKNAADNSKSINKTAFVLELPADMSAKEVIDKGKAAGIKLTDRYVYSIRSKAKVRGGNPGRRGRPRGTGNKDGTLVGRGQSGSAGALESRFFDVALDLGLSKAESLLSSLRARVKQAIG